MKINQVELLVGITKKNIRFYEEQGLLSPGRNRENGYRDYNEEDVRTLEQIKLFRKLVINVCVFLDICPNMAPGSSGIQSIDIQPAVTDSRYCGLIGN